MTTIQAGLTPPNASAVCTHCGRPLGESPSRDFCSETCQQQWQATHPATTAATTTEPQGAEVLDQVAAFVARFNAFPSEHCAPTLALWYAHTHIADHLYITPRLILDSAEPGSGTTRVLEVAQFLVAAPEMTISPSVAALFRLVAAGPITILFDEIDAVFNPKNTTGANEDLRALLNAGYKCSATIPRCVGDAKSMKVQRFKTYAPAALAGIAGGMPDTITTRAITLHLRRRRRDERAEAFRERKVEREAAPIRDALAAWITPLGARIGDVEPEMPDGVVDRSAEIWEPLLAIADQAGGHWPETARAACRHFVLTGGPQGNSLGIHPLADIQHVFHRHGTDRMTTADLLADLVTLDEAPWADLDGKHLDARRLARELGRYGIKSKDIKLPGGQVAKGYRADGEEGLGDAWRRYLPTVATSATRATSLVKSVADETQVARPATIPATQVEPSSATGHANATNLTRQVADVAQVADDSRQLPGEVA